MYVVRLGDSCVEDFETLNGREDVVLGTTAGVAAVCRGGGLGLP